MKKAFLIIAIFNIQHSVMAISILPVEDLGLGFTFIDLSFGGLIKNNYSGTFASGQQNNPSDETPYQHMQNSESAQLNTQGFTPPGSPEKQPSPYLKRAAAIAAVEKINAITSSTNNNSDPYDSESEGQAEFDAKSHYEQKAAFTSGTKNTFFSNLHDKWGKSHKPVPKETLEVLRTIGIETLEDFYALTSNQIKCRFKQYGISKYKTKTILVIRRKAQNRSYSRKRRLKMNNKQINQQILINN